MASFVDYDNDDADQQPIDWGDPQPEGDFSGSTEDEEWGGR